MTIRMTARQAKRWGSVALVATMGCLANTAISHAGDGPQMFSRQPSGPIFKTLDTFAGGIEFVLEKTVLGHGKKKKGCDAQSCDDGCDAVTLHQLNMHHNGNVAVPQAIEPLPPPSGPMHSMPTESVPPIMDVEPTFDRPIRKSVPQPMPELSTDDGWIDSFAPSTPSRNAAPGRRAPAADDALPNPFEDDPQTRTAPQRFSPMSAPSEQSQATRLQFRKPGKAAGFRK